MHNILRQLTVERCLQGGIVTMLAMTMLILNIATGTVAPADAETEAPFTVDDIVIRVPITEEPVFDDGPYWAVDCELNDYRDFRDELPICRVYAHPRGTMEEILDVEFTIEVQKGRMKMRSALPSYVIYYHREEYLRTAPKTSFWIDQPPWPGYGNDGTFREFGLDAHFFDRLRTGETLFAHRKLHDGTITAPVGYDLAPFRKAIALAEDVVAMRGVTIDSETLPYSIYIPLTRLWNSRLDAGMPPWDLAIASCNLEMGDTGDNCKWPLQLATPNAKPQWKRREGIVVSCGEVASLDSEFRTFYEQAPDDVRDLIVRAYLEVLPDSQAVLNPDWYQGYGPEYCPGSVRGAKKSLAWITFLVAITDQGRWPLPQWRVQVRDWPRVMGGFAATRRW